MDLITWKLVVSKAMSQFLGITGQSIPLDILHVDNSVTQHSYDTPAAWIRVPETELSAVWSGLSGARGVVNDQDVSIRVVRASRYLQGLEEH
jgi:ribonuclease P/MRP protein subunit POP8